MRIVIDLQISQLSDKFDKNLYDNINKLVKSISLNEFNNQIYIILNAKFYDVSKELQAYLLEFLPKENIYFFDYIYDAVENFTSAQKDFNEAIRETFIGELEPDFLLIFNISSIIRDDIILSFKKFLDIPTVLVNCNSAREEYVNIMNEQLFPSNHKVDLIINLTNFSYKLNNTNIQFNQLPTHQNIASPNILQLEFNNNLNLVADEILAFLGMNVRTNSLTTKQNSNLPISNKKRLAYFSPIPPARSGISDYSSELLMYLSNYYEITVIVDGYETTDTWIKSNLKVRQVEWFIQYARSFERIIYQMGNSEFHSYMLNLLPLYPGIVILHDFYLSNMYGYMSWKKNPPFSLKQNLYYSHGYPAIQALEQESYPKQAIWEYPTNLKVIQDSLGIIVHSENSKDLADQWYGLSTSKDWHLIPHLREKPTVNDKKAARQKLGLPENAFIVCSFGIIGKTKLSLEIAKAFLESKISSNPNAYLIFVGKNDSGEYGEEILQTISSAELQNRITITEWVDLDEFRLYLQAADMGVQLRTLSRGETSGTVLDCLNYGLPTIVNANGSMAYLNKDSVLMLPDNFSLSQLTEAFDRIYDSPSLRQQLTVNALSTIDTMHQPADCAFKYYQAIEYIYNSQSNKLYGLLYNHLAKGDIIIENPNQIEVIANNFPPTPTLNQLFFDVTVLSHTDLKTGIERVTRALLLTLLKNPPQGWRIEPIYSRLDLKTFYYARKFTLDLLGLSTEGIEDAEIEYRKGDIYINVELNHHHTVEQQDFYHKLQIHGVKLVSFVHDILPVTMPPEYFVKELPNRHANWLDAISNFDQIVCVTRAVADDVYEWLDNYATAQRFTPLKLDWSHSGADMDNSLPTTGMPNDSEQVLEKLNQSVTFLAVGTIEPKKAYKQLLDAFNLLWKKGINVNLAIVGKAGWNVEELIDEINTHTELNKRLFWFTGISDEYLEKIYDASDCLIAASYGEGFGLPLVEAAQHDLPIIARNIPVFQEVAKEYATYFADTKDSQVIADCVLRWLDLKRDNKIPAIQNMPWLTWEESTQRLLQILFDKTPPYKVWLPKNAETGGKLA